MNWWRITRYDPVHRTESGAYGLVTWTSIYDVDKVFEGVRLTLAEYGPVEDAYVQTVLDFMAESAVSELIIDEVTPGPRFRDGQRFGAEEVGRIIRAMLREDALSTLSSHDDRFAVHAASDLYMWIGSETECPAAVARAERRGLYVDENFPSPFLEGN